MGYQIVTYRDKQIRHFLLVALPGLAILSSASVDVSVGAVNDHDHEKDKVKPRKWTPISIQLATANLFYKTGEIT